MEFGVYAMYVRTAHSILHEEAKGNTESEFSLSCSYQSEKLSNYLFISKQIKLVFFWGGGGRGAKSYGGEKAWSSINLAILSACSPSGSLSPPPPSALETPVKGWGPCFRMWRLGIFAEVPCAHLNRIRSHSTTLLLLIAT